MEDQMNYTYTFPASPFELGEDTNRQGRKALEAYITYTKDSVMRYRVGSIDALKSDTTILVKMINHHLEHQVPRLRMLEEYYLANNPAIMTGQRRLDDKKSDHRARHNFAAIISDFLNDHVLGNPVKIESDDEDLLAVVEEFNFDNDIDSHNIEIGKDQNNFGRAFEMLQRTEEDTDKIYRLDPYETFMIYDLTVRSRVIGAVRYFPVEEYDKESNLYQVELYDYEKITRYKPDNISSVSVLSDPQEEEHSFNGVPIVEYRSNRYRMGVYEPQIPLIDLYDAAQSDTANYMTDFNDALLVIDGNYKNIKDGTALEGLRDANILALIPELDENGRPQDGSAYYLTKSYDVSGVESYKDRIKQDIFTGSSIPDLSDDKFGGNRSGESLKYKIFGLQQKRNDKEKYFAKGLRVRYKLLENLKNNISEYSGAGQLDFKFTPKLPEAHLESLREFVAAGGRISQEAMIGLLPFVDDVAFELERVREEKIQNQKDFLKSSFPEVAAPEAQDGNEEE